MKKFKLVLILLLTSLMLSAQNYFYYYKGEKIPLTISNKKVIVKFSEGLTFEQKKQVIASDFALKQLEKSKAEVLPNISIVNIEKGNESSVQQIIIYLNKNKNVVSTNPVFVYKDSSLQGLTGEFLVKLKSPADYLELQRLAKETKTKIVKQNQFDPSVYILESDKNSNGNALKMANYFYETKIFEFAEPNFLGIDIIRSNDPYFSDQWSLQNTGQYSGTSGADMNVPNAWSITMGRDDITVAVVDEGVDLVHPDLIDNILPGFDAAGQGTGGAPTGDDAHGTACAGIIAAKANNGIGIAGVCPDCKILPVRALPEGNSTATMLADGINWAWQNGADVISNSWHFSQSSLIDNAINNAVTSGRGGLGCVVLFAAGNENNSVSYPASLPNVIAVGAMSMCNERKRSSKHSSDVNPGVTPDPDGVSCDDEKWWGSNYGTELDVVAPGVKISTTDISGSAGYNNITGMEMYNNDYVKNFNGTSSATPNAAGVCALILSINRCLTYSQVAQILELSCDKVGFYCYNTTSGHSNGTWNNQMGYGRVDAYNAVRYAFSTEINTYTNVSGTDQGANDCSGNLCTWQLIAGGCSGLAAANYYVYWHRVDANVTYPNTPGANIIATSNGFSYSSPNSGNYFAGASNVTSTSATLYTYVFETYNILGQFLGWVPTAPQNIRFNYHVLSILDQDIYLQNQTVSTGTEVHNAMNKIVAGSNVTNAVPVGDYIVQGDANITLHGGNSVTLEPGTIIQPGPNGSFVAYADPFFTCSQYPMGKMASTNGDNSGYPPVIKDYEVIILKDTATTTASENNLIRIFPNPFSDNTTIEYRIGKSASVTIIIHDNCGKPFYILKNKSIHDAGTYQIKLTGINLPAGVYFCTLQADNYKETIKMIKTE